MTAAQTTARRLSRTALLIIVCGCAIALLNNGPRTALGFFLTPMSAENGWGRSTFSLAMAIQNLAWGFGAFLFGAAADRWGTARVLAGCALVYAAGLVLMSLSTSGAALDLTAGVMIGLGIGGSSFGIVMGAFGRVVSARQRTLVFGIATAAASLGQFVFAPLTQGLIEALGWQTALVALAGLVVLIPVLAIPLAGRPDHLAQHEVAQTMGEALWEALGHRSYLLLAAGFFVCGFQVAFITTHFPAYIADQGLDPRWGATALMLIGLFNIFGSLGSGALGMRVAKRHLLAGIYLGRSVLYTVFLMLPASPASVLTFSAILGVLWLSTVPPTNGLVAIMFGTRYFAMLAGVVFLAHQVGSFLGVWLGGVLYDLNRSYDPVWWIAVALGVFAGLVHLPIVERTVDRPAARPLPAE
jgi:predicted MFS family arabinose efflux permease